MNNTYKKSLILFLFLTTRFVTFSQSQLIDSVVTEKKSKYETSNSLLTGIESLNKDLLIEFGYARVKDNNSRCGLGYYFKGKSISASISPLTGNTGIKFNYWNSLLFMFVFGTEVNAFIFNKEFSTGIRPYLGIGNGKIAINTGVNVSLSTQLKVNVLPTFALRYCIYKSKKRLEYIE